ncbi:MAG: YaaC family protein [Ignavibacteriaceae bacterium]|jgi:hypothetical protein
MNDIWHFLREFESKELVKRFIKKKFDYSLNSSKAFEITSAFTQGREYFTSYVKADISVKPLLQYYGIVALSRGLILILNKSARENNITPSHGLKIKNWNDIVKFGKLEDVIMKSSKGTFTELINVTKNKSYFRAGCSGINWHVQYDVPSEDIEFNLKEISLCFPDLNQSVKSWLNVEVPSRALNKLKHPNEHQLELEIQGKYDVNLLSQIFPSSIFQGLEISEAENNCIVRFNENQMPNLSQKWVSAFQVIGDPYVTPPFQNGIFLNDISKMYSASFVFGTISRYYPSTWSNINKGIANDGVLPFAINLMDFLQDKYPKIVMDFIKSPYEFENK